MAFTRHNPQWRGPGGYAQTARSAAALDRGALSWSATLASNACGAKGRVKKPEPTSVAL
jgi:hypothetical protein